MTDHDILNRIIYYIRFIRISFVCGISICINIKKSKGHQQLTGVRYESSSPSQVTFIVVFEGWRRLTRNTKTILRIDLWGGFCFIKDNSKYSRKICQVQFASQTFWFSQIRWIRWYDYLCIQSGDISRRKRVIIVEYCNVIVQKQLLLEYIKRSYLSLSFRIVDWIVEVPGTQYYKI